MLVAAAADRNKEPILDVLRQYVSPAAPVVWALEVASGTGQHIFPGLYLTCVGCLLRWTSAVCGGDISEYISRWSLTNVEQPRTLDASRSWVTWGLEPNSLQLVVCINMIHISEPVCTQGLFYGAGHVLQPGGVLLTYGPYSVNGILTPQSNIDFNQSLKNRYNGSRSSGKDFYKILEESVGIFVPSSRRALVSNPAWGIWDTSDLNELAKTCGMALERMVDMPANNKCLIFRKM